MFASTMMIAHMRMRRNTPPHTAIRKYSSNQQEDGMEMQERQDGVVA
jgi:hypothetical protein